MLAAICSMSLQARAVKPITIESPSGRNRIEVTLGNKLYYSVISDGKPVISPTAISMTLDNGITWGATPQLTKKNVTRIRKTDPAFCFSKDSITDNCTQLVLEFRGDYGIVFRAYDDAIAYRFLSFSDKEYRVLDEHAAFPVPGDCETWCAYVKIKEPTPVKKQFGNSFENDYTHARLSELDPERLIFTPSVIALPSGKRLLLAESDLEDYPGMFLRYDPETRMLRGAFAPRPLADKWDGRYGRQVIAIEDCIASICGPRAFPWRIVGIADSDKKLLYSDIVYRLAAPSRVADTSWIRPGKVAWDWWNNWGLTGVDFKAGPNTPTYKYYIDFAAAHGLEYVILDEGWSNRKTRNLFDLNPEINLQEILEYAASKNVHIILWAGYDTLCDRTEAVFAHYARMGVAGFKIDFMDRDDQKMVQFIYNTAELAAKYRLVVMYHGMYKPTGINRTYPNVLTFEGVRGAEYFKWSAPEGYDEITYDVSIPFLRNLAGPMDYTPGGMRNVSLTEYRPNNKLPVVQGTRCRQLAMYVVFDSPISMLCDSPSAYQKEPESIDFIAEVPTVWDESHALEGRIGECVAVARRKDNIWYIAGMAGNTPEELTLDLGMIPEGKYCVELFTDGVNASKYATDYKRSEFSLPADRKLNISMVAGGGFAARIQKAE